MQRTTPLLKACHVVGGQSKLAQLVGVTPQAVHQWLARGRPPVERVLAIEAATSGKIPRHHLRPDIYPEPA
jgi:DNA-binding transcriptional regulator YdaS (Cro superfamily)